METKKNKWSDFYKNKKIDDIDVNKVLISKEEPNGTKNSFKYFIRYDDNVIRPLYIKLPQILVILENLKAIQQSPLRLVIKNC